MEKFKEKRAIYYYPYESIVYRQWATIDVAVERLEKGIDGPNATVYTSPKEAYENARNMRWELIDAGVICIEIEGEKCFARYPRNTQERIELSANVRDRLKVINNVEEVYYYPIPQDESCEYENLERGINFLQQKGEQIEVYREGAEAINSGGYDVLCIEKTKEKCIAWLIPYVGEVVLDEEFIAKIKVVESQEQAKTKKRQ